MHISVLQKEVTEILSPQPGQKFIDGTAGAGGHSLEILKRIYPNGKLLAIDLDKEALARVKRRIVSEADVLENNLILTQGNFAEIDKIAKLNGMIEVDGIIADFGFSSDQLDSGRGFTFQRDEPLDMRYDIRQKLTAKEIINTWPQKEIEKIIGEFGQERYARNISEKIIKARQNKLIETTGELVKIISHIRPRKDINARIHFATKTFQAIRIAVNNELGNIKNFLQSALGILKPGGRLVVISFHSLEDRMVKKFFREAVQVGKLELLVKKPLTPTDEEIIRNPRSRSAKLRAGQKI